MKVRTVSRMALIAWMTIVACTLPSCRPAAEPDTPQATGAGQAQRADAPKTAGARKVNLIPSRLLASDSVQQDLNLTDAQQEKVAEFKKSAKLLLRELADIWQDHPAGHTESMSEAEGQAMGIRMRDMTTISNKLQAEVVGLLTPNQRERLKQIELQYTIAIALTQPLLARELGLSEDQLAKIRQHAQTSILAEPLILDGVDLSDDELAELTPSPELLDERDAATLKEFAGLTADEAFQRMLELGKANHTERIEANQAALSVLTSEQRTKLEAFIGKQLELDWALDE